jgi:hypothetical protein
VITLSRSKKSAHGGYEDEEKRPPLPIGHYLVILLVLGTAFAVRYWFNFIDDNHLNTHAAFDASEYLRNAEAMLKLGPSLPENFWSDSFKVIQGTADAATIQNVRNALSSLKGLQIAGPVFPAFLALCYALSLAPFSMANWQAPLFGQCVVSALTCVFITLTGCKAFGKISGYIAGILAVIYPAFIINSGRLYSETFAAFLLSVVLYITARNFADARQSTLGGFFVSNLVNGFFTACLQLTRSMMVALSAALIPIVLFQQGIRRGIFGVMALVIGFMLVAAPWLGFQKLAFGTTNLVVDRVGHYNFFIGNNVDTAGWLSFPYPDGRGIEEKSLPTLAKESYEKSPSRWLRLMQDKPVRLFKFPWNDFRAAVGQFDFSAQVVLHQVILLFAAIGIILSYLVKQRRSGPDTAYEQGTPLAGESRSSNAAKTLILFVLILHCAYMMFITVPRYNLTAMPELILFAGAGFGSLISLLQLRRGAVAALSLCVSVLFLFAFLHMPIVPVVATLIGGQNAGIGLVVQSILRAVALLTFGLGLWLAIGALTEREIGDERRHVSHASAPRLAVVVMIALLFPVLVLPVNADGRPYEWSASMTEPNQQISQQISIPADFAHSAAGRQTYLLIDANGLEGLAQTQVEINGQKLDAPLIPGIAMCDDFARYQDVNDHSYMREGEWIFDCLTQSTGMHNSDLRQWFLVPVAASLLKPGSTIDVRLRNMSSGPSATIYGAYPAQANSVTVPSVSVCSWEKAFYGVENADHLSDPRYDIKTRSLATAVSDKDLSPAPGKQSGRFNIHLLTGPAVPFNDSVYTVSASRPPAANIIIERTQPFAAALMRDSKPHLSINTALAHNFDERTMWIVRVSGKARRNNGTGKLSIGVKALTADKNKQSTAIAYNSPWGTDTHVGREWRRFDVAVPLAPGALRAPATRLVIDMNMIGTKAENGMAIDGITEVKDTNLEILRLPNNPLQGAYQLY